jgi:hypothetical protein
MIIYNVTVKVDQSVSEEWLTWMQAEHIPKVMLTGCFVEHHIFKVLVDDPDGPTFSIQYLCRNMDDYDRYQELHAKDLQAETQKLYGNRMVAFRTLLELVA